MKYEFIDDYLYIDGKKIDIKFDFLSYERSVCCLSGEYQGKIITRQVQNEQDFCSNYDYEQYKLLFEIQGGSVNFELLQDMKVLHGMDLEKEMMAMFRCIGCRIIDKELSHLFDKEHKKALVIARLKNMQQDFE